MTPQEPAFSISEIRAAIDECYKIWHDEKWGGCPPAQLKRTVDDTYDSLRRRIVEVLERGRQAVPPIHKLTKP